MALNKLPVNTATVGGLAYDAPQNQVHQFAIGAIGLPCANALSSSNGNYAVFTAPVNCFIYQFSATSLLVGTTAAAALTLALVQANNGANISNTITFQNTLTVGTNVAGNIAGVLEFSYNVAANGSNDSSNVVHNGGFYVNAGSVLYANCVGNTSYLGYTLEWVPAGNASYHL